jgi:hypothetical protein
VPMRRMQINFVAHADKVLTLRLNRHRYLAGR